MKNKMKKIVSLMVFLCLFVFSGKAVLTSYAESSGKYGDNLTWTLSDDGTLTISGTGHMKDIGSSENPPWEADRENITKVVIEDGVTSLGDYAFKGCSNLISVSIPKTAMSINVGHPFEGCTKLESVTFFSDFTDNPNNDINRFQHWPKCLKDIYFIGPRWGRHEDIIVFFPSAIAHNFVYVSAEYDENCGTVRGGGMWEVGESNRYEIWRTEITLQAIPEEGYVFAGWERNGQLVSTENPWNSTFEKMRNYQNGEEYLWYLELKAIFRKELTIAVKEQTYIYDGQPHGESDPAYDDPAVISEKVTVNGLLETDELTMVELDGEETEIGEYADRIEVTGFSINNDPGAKDKYEVTLVPGKLIIKKEEPPVPPTHVHSLTVVMAKPATCEESGNKSYYTCSICGKWFEDDTALVEITDKSSVIVKALGHKWDSGVVTKAPTATKDGIRTYTCLRDSSHTKTELIPRRERGHSNHDEPEVTFAPIEDAWLMDGAGWHYRENGVLVKNAWRILRYNGKSYWYLFDENGTMKTGWAEWKGERYYLSPVSDGWMGHMLTGWQEIDGKWYYFETAEGSTQGRMYRNEKTPDGRFVGEDGALIEGA
ncbi:MAG: leucine-rich repeat protein [Lachnospiraceae bacterium]|nr:leucine-rich repeat protein [Lachnospiraceae bacterium]